MSQQRCLETFVSEVIHPKGRLGRDVAKGLAAPYDNFFLNARWGLPCNTISLATL
jgi:hypothetical protein